MVPLSLDIVLPLSLVWLFRLLASDQSGSGGGNGGGVGGSVGAGDAGGVAVGDSSTNVLLHNSFLFYLLHYVLAPSLSMFKSSSLPSAM